MKTDPRRIDMHLHSYFSDGELSPEELVKECKEADLEYIALTDHDNIQGITEAIAAAQKTGIQIVLPSSAEFTAEYNGKTEHILGYGLDSENQQLNSFLRSVKKAKINHAKQKVEMLKKFGFEISLGESLSLVRGTIEDFHLWQVISQNPRNSFTLRQLNVENPKQFYEKILKGSFSRLKREKPQVRTIIKIIQAAEGIAIWAHPFWKRNKPSEIQEKTIIFKEFGLDGIEVCYSRHSREHTLALHKIAKDLLMIETIGSDFHAFARKSDERKIGEIQTYNLKLNLPF